MYMPFEMWNINANNTIDQTSYEKGYEDAYNQMSSMVKKLGKKHYKEFLLELKKEHNEFYTSYTASTHPHKCNCEYCELSD